MNNKIEIWKRKLAKEHRKQQLRMWNRLKYEPNITIDHTDLEFSISDEIVDDLAKMIADEIDKEIIEGLK